MKWVDSSVLKPAFGYTGMELSYLIRVMERDLEAEFARRIVPITLKSRPTFSPDTKGSRSAFHMKRSC
jgi:hypothetical protein